MATLHERLRTIRDGIAAGCTTDELTADVEVLASLVDIASPELERQVTG